MWTSPIFLEGHFETDLAAAITKVIYHNGGFVVNLLTGESVEVPNGQAGTHHQREQYARMKTEEIMADRADYLENVATEAICN